jgi:hypothetical protein
MSITRRRPNNRRTALGFRGFSFPFIFSLLSLRFAGEIFVPTAFEPVPFIGEHREHIVQKPIKISFCWVPILNKNFYITFGKNKWCYFSFANQKGSL